MSRSPAIDIYCTVRVNSCFINKGNSLSDKSFVAMADLCKPAMFHHNIVGQNAVPLLNALLREQSEINCGKCQNSKEFLHFML